MFNVAVFKKVSERFRGEAQPLLNLPEGSIIRASDGIRYAYYPDTNEVISVEHYDPPKKFQLVDSGYGKRSFQNHNDKQIWVDPKKVDWATKAEEELWAYDQTLWES